MIKPIQTRSATVNVLDEAKLEQVVGGRGQRGGYRRDYGHCFEKRRNDCHNHDGGYEGKGYCEDSYDSSDCYSDSYDNNDYCERKSS